MAVVLFCEYIVVAVKCDSRQSRRAVCDAYGEKVVEGIAQSGQRGR